jgi:tetratricopeptide (TPR) repeat protein
MDQRDLATAATLLRQAVREQQAALTSHSKYPDYRQSLSEHFQELFPLLFRLGKHSEAAEDAELFASLLPERGCDVSAAVQVLNVCVGMVDRDMSRTESDRAATKKRYIDRARDLHQEAIRRCSGDPDMQNLLAWQLATLPQDWIRNPAKGVELAEQAVRGKPTEAAFWTTLGLARHRAGDSNGAVEALTEAVRLGKGGTARDWLYLAMAHKRLNNEGDARRWYERATADEINDGKSDWELKALRAEAAAVFNATTDSK